MCGGVRDPAPQLTGHDDYPRVSRPPLKEFPVELAAGSHSVQATETFFSFRIVIFGFQFCGGTGSP